MSLVSRIVISEIEAIMDDIRRNEPFPTFPWKFLALAQGRALVRTDVRDKLSVVTLPDLAKGPQPQG